VSVLVTARSTFVLLTVVFVVVALLDVSGSASKPITDALLAIVPLAVGITTMVTVDEAPTVRVPMLHVSVAVPEQVPWVVLVVVRIRLDNTLSVRITLVEVDGPLFVTVRTYVRDAPTRAGSGVASLEILRSAAGLTVVVAVSVLLERLGSATLDVALA